MLRIEYIPDSEIDMYLEEDIETLLGEEDYQKYKKTFLIIKRICDLLGIEKQLYLSYVDYLQDYDFELDYIPIQGEALDPEEHDIDYPAILITNDRVYSNIDLELLLVHELRHVWQFNNFSDEEMRQKQFEEWAVRYPEIDAVAFEMLYAKEVLEISIEEEFASKLTDDVRKRMSEIVRPWAN